jgi:hypothetical protein
MGRHEGKAELVLERVDRPFLGLGERPIAGREPLKEADVLDDTVFLVVGFFDQEDGCPG